MRGREQLLITVDGLPRLTEMKSTKSLKRGQNSVMEAGAADDGAVPKAAKLDNNLRKDYVSKKSVVYASVI